MPARIADISELLLELGLTGTISDKERAIANICLRRAEAAVRRHLQYDPAQETRTEYYPQMDHRVPERQGVWEANETHAYFRESIEYGMEDLQLKHIPVRSVTSLKVDYDGRFGTKNESFPESSAWTEGTDFWPNYDKVDSQGNSFCSDGILRAEGGWPSAPGTIKVVYVAGYTDAEFHGDDEVVDASPILEAVIDEATRRVHKIYSRMKGRAGFGKGAFTSENLGDYSYSVNTAAMNRLIGGGMDLLPETIHKLQDYVNWGLSLA